MEPKRLAAAAGRLRSRSSVAPREAAGPRPPWLRLCDRPRWRWRLGEAAPASCLAMLDLLSLTSVSCSATWTTIVSTS